MRFACVLDILWAPVIRLIGLKFDLRSMKSKLWEVVLKSANPAQVVRVAHHPWAFLFCWYYILRKILETCASMTFSYFQRQSGWCQNYFAKMSLKAYIGVPYHPWLPDMYQIPDTLLSQHFNAIFSANSIWPDMTTDTLYVKSLRTPWLYLKKMDLTRAWRFLRTNKKSPLFWWYLA